MPISPITLLSLSQARHGQGIVSLVQLVLVALFHAVSTHASPLYHAQTIYSEDEPQGKPASDPSLYAYLGTAIALVLLGGVFAGLTIALMGQDEVYLQVISTSGEGSEKKSAAKVLRLLNKGKHWVLVTLLVGNVITNETLPLVLDRSIGGGYAAAISSTVLVIIFGEIVPQSICVRFGLPVGALMSPFVLILMWIFAPITWPIAKLLDYLLGEDHGTVYKKSGLKTLVTLHKTMGMGGERLNEDEVAIISGVLDLKAKRIGDIMTPMNDVFTLAADACLDEHLIEIIMREGYSRIPINVPGNKGDFVGMLLVKMLITYDPEDARRVDEFALATLPETRPDTSCLDIINFFQEGKSHMVLVSDFPGQSYGAIGVVTLEDVIEELIGEEIIDESDVFVDVHKAIRRLQPAPTTRQHFRAKKGQFYEDNNSQAIADEHQLKYDGATQKKEYEDNSGHNQSNGKRDSIASNDDRKTTFLVRRPSNVSATGSEVTQVQMSQSNAELRQQLRNIGPSNMASRPRQTRINTVKVKPGVGTIPENKDVAKQLQRTVSSFATTNTETQRPVETPEPTGAQGGIGQDLVDPGPDAKDGVQALQTGYGTLDRISGSPGRNQGEARQMGQGSDQRPEASTSDAPQRPEKFVIERSGSHSTLGSLHSQSSGSIHRRRTTARSGSITENFVETGGVKKMVLEPSSSSDEENAVDHKPAESSSKGKGNKSRSRGPSHSGRSKSNAPANGASQSSTNAQDGSREGENGGEGKAKKKRRPHRHKKKKDGQKGTGDENTPLLGRE